MRSHQKISDFGFLILDFL